MIAIAYKPSFLREFKRLDPQLQQEAAEKIEIFKKKENHQQLKVHKLSGPLKDCYAFQVNYKFRIIFEYESSKEEVTLLGINNHKYR